MEDKIIRTYVDGQEFGETVHLGALGVVAFTRVTPLHVVYILEKNKDPATAARARRFLEACHVKMEEREKAKHLNDTEQKKMVKKNFDKKSGTLEKQVEAGVYTMAPSSSTSTIVEIVKVENASVKTRAIRESAHATIKNHFSTLGDHKAAEKILNAALGNTQTKKALIWARIGERDAYRNTSPNAMRTMVEAALEAGLQPVLIGVNQDKMHSLFANNAALKAKCIDFTEQHSALFSADDSFLQQAALYTMMPEKNVVAAAGFQSGGMDFCAFCGIPTANIVDLDNKAKRFDLDKKQKTHVETETTNERMIFFRDRMSALENCSSTTNFRWLADYDASGNNNPDFPADKNELVKFFKSPKSKD